MNNSKNIDDTEIKNAANYFNSLPDEKKAQIATNVLNKDEKLFPLIQAIISDVANYDKKVVVSKLINLGINHVYAAILVEQIIEKRPTLKYHLKVIARLNDDKLRHIKTIFDKFWIHKYDIKKISADHDITIDDCVAIRSVCVNMLNSIIRHDVPMGYYTKLFKNVKLSDIGIKSMYDVITSHKETWKNMLIFSNTQDAYFELKNVDNKINLILKSIKELSEFIKKSSNSNNQSHYQ